MDTYNSSFGIVCNILYTIWNVWYTEESLVVKPQTPGNDLLEDPNTYRGCQIIGFALRNEMN